MCRPIPREIVMFEYLVTCAGKKKKVLVNEKEEIYGEIIATFKLDPQSELELQAWDCTWEDYVDVDDVESLPDSCKLNASLLPTSKTSVPSVQDISNPTGR